MKKMTGLILLTLCCLLVFAGCACEHEWVEADCVNPRTCSLCEEIEGAPLGHSWYAATCAAPKTCENCGATEGETLPHTWQDADCVTPKTCTECGATEGEALGHEWIEATYTSPQTCNVCGATEGETLKRENLGLTVDELVALANSYESTVSLRMDYLGLDEDNWPVYSITDVSTGTVLNANVYLEPDYDGETVYSILLAAESTDETATYNMGVLAGVMLVSLDSSIDNSVIAELTSSEPTIEDGMVCYALEHNGILIELYASDEVVFFWISPAE